MLIVVMYRIYCLTSVALLLLSVGCTESRLTHPRRTATEIYLLTTAVQQAIRPVSAEMLRGRLVYMDEQFVPNDDDHKYLVAASRAKLLAGGARMTTTREDAEIIVEMRTPGVGIDHSKFLLGIPGLPIGQLMTAAGVPAGTISTPELALIRNEKQWGTAGVAYVAYWQDTGEIIASSGPHIGRSYREDWSVFGFSKTISNIPPSEPPEAHEMDELPEPAADDPDDEPDADPDAVPGSDVMDENGAPVADDADAGAEAPDPPREPGDEP